MKHVKNGPKAVIFDLDNTVVQTETPWAKAWVEMYRSKGVELNPDTWRALMTNNVHPAEYLFRAHGVVLNDVYVGRIRSRVMGEIRASGTMPGVGALIDQCRDAGVRVALATNGTMRWVEEVLPKRVQSRFDVITTINDVGRRLGKPFPFIHQKVLKCLGVEPNQTLGIEDSKRGVTALTNAKIPPLLVPSETDPLLDDSSFDQPVAVRGSLQDLSLQDLCDVHSGLVGLGRPALVGL